MEKEEFVEGQVEFEKKIYGKVLSCYEKEDWGDR